MMVVCVQCGADLGSETDMIAAGLSPNTMVRCLKCVKKGYFIKKIEEKAEEIKKLTEKLAEL